MAAAMAALVDALFAQDADDVDGGPPEPGPGGGADDGIDIDGGGLALSALFALADTETDPDDTVDDADNNSRIMAGVNGYELFACCKCGLVADGMPLLAVMGMEMDPPPTMLTLCVVVLPELL